MKAYTKATKILAVICILSLIIQGLSACEKKTVTAAEEAFSDGISFTFLTESSEEVNEYFSNMMSAVRQAEADFSLNEGSYLHTLNETGTAYASDSLKKALEDSVIICTALGDITDITMGSVMKLWGFYTESPSVPEKEPLNEAAGVHSIDELIIARDSNKLTVTEGTEIDMSPVKKGITLDRLFAAGKPCSIPYTVSLGDVTLAYGEGPDKGSWEINLKNPLSENSESFAKISVRGKGDQNNIFVSSSGIWENSFSENGKTYHSYLDPETGYPCDNGLAAVTVVTEAGITADALSDAILINGFTEKSLDYLNSFFAQAVFVFTDGTYYVTEGLRDSFRLTDSSFTEHTEAPATELF